MREDQVMNTNEVRKGDSSSSSFVMDHDEESTRSESTLTFTSCIDDNGYSESTISVTHSSISMSVATGVIYKLSGANAKRSPLRYLRVTHVTTKR